MTDSLTNDHPDVADFEAAISATEHGLFNYILLFVSMFACFATVFETSTMSYILASAECDLKLTLIDKGMLNGITYAGMISSAIIWGFLADTLGRKKLLVFGFLADAVCDIFASFSPNIQYLMAFKFLGGFVVCGPFAVLMAYVTEFHGIKHRPRTMMCIGFFFSLATLVLPLLAYGILPNNWRFLLFGVSITSWKIFLASCAIPSLVSGIAFIFLPESPKFQMSTGYNEKALETFQLIFARNTGKTKEEYPVKNLFKEIAQKPGRTADDNENNSSKWKTIIIHMQQGFMQLKPMFRKPYLGQSIHVYTVQFCTLLGLNTLRLWLPQLFATITKYEDNMTEESAASNLCTILSDSVYQDAKQRVFNDCVVNINLKTYYNQMIVATTGIISYFMAGILINGLGNKTILIIALGLSGTCGVCMIWTTNSTSVLIVSSLYVALGSLGSTALLGVIVNLFPTTLRTMTVSLAMMFGRLGALIGNILFPFFLSTTCIAPFLMVGLAMFVSSLLSIFLPTTAKKPLK